MAQKPLPQHVRGKGLGPRDLAMTAWMYPAAAVLPQTVLGLLV
jgi:hypothetical protein